MAYSNDELMGTEMHVDDHPSDNIEHPEPGPRVKVAGDVVPLPINPLFGSDRKSSTEDAAQYSVGDKRGSDPKVRSIGTNTVLDWVDRAKARGR